MPSFENTPSLLLALPNELLLLILLYIDHADYGRLRHTCHGLKSQVKNEWGKLYFSRIFVEHRHLRDIVMSEWGDFIADIAISGQLAEGDLLAPERRRRSAPMIHMPKLRSLDICATIVNEGALSTFLISHTSTLAEIRFEAVQLLGSWHEPLQCIVAMPQLNKLTLCWISDSREPDDQELQDIVYEEEPWDKIVLKTREDIDRAASSLPTVKTRKELCLCESNPQYLVNFRTVSAADEEFTREDEIRPVKRVKQVLHKDYLHRMLVVPPIDVYCEKVRPLCRLQKDPDWIRSISAIKRVEEIVRLSPLTTIKRRRWRNFWKNFWRFDGNDQDAVFERLGRIARSMTTVVDQPVYRGFM